MSDDLSCRVEGCDYTGTPVGLRSHVHGRSDPEHSTAAEAAAWEEWYPEAYGEAPETLDDEPEEGPSDGGSDDPPKDPSDGTLETADDDPDGGPNGQDSDEYADQYRQRETVDAGEATPVDDPGDGGSGPGLGVLLAGAAGLAAAVLLAGTKSNGQRAPSGSSDGAENIPTDPNDALALPGDGSAGDHGQDDGTTITMEDGEVFG